MNKEQDGSEKSTGVDFIRQIINEDLRMGKNGGRVATRFPPEPNGYLHIGHAKSICLNFGIARDYNGTCNLRFDDTNPVKEDTEYVESIMEDVKWLGFQWDNLFYASDYFDILYEYAEHLIKAGKAYVCDLTPEQVREYRGTLTEPGKESPYRNRSVEENLDLFRRMRAGEFPDGSRTLRAKIDMAHPNMNMRDPALYRIKHATHHRTGDKWCIYPMYDFAHGQCDAIEGITHSICTLEFEDHRPLYEWFLDNLPVPSRPRQIEFARLNLTRTVMSKRKLLLLVKHGIVDGWDDPRMPTIAGLRRRGYTPEAIRMFCERIGVSKANSTVDIALLEHCIREDLNKKAQRRMAVLKPLKVVITNYPENQVEWLDAVNNPENEADGIRKIPFSRELYIEKDDFMEKPPKKFFRLYPGNEVRLKHAYYIKCNEVIKDEKGEIIELRCTYDPDSRGGWTADGRKVKGTLHWVSVPHAIRAEVRLYDYLLKESAGSEGMEAREDMEVSEQITRSHEDENARFLAELNPDSLQIIENAMLEPSLKEARIGDRFQFLRQGYFCLDSKYSKENRPVFNRIVNLVDTWAKLVGSGRADE